MCKRKGQTRFHPSLRVSVLTCWCKTSVPDEVITFMYKLESVVESDVTILLGFNGHLLGLVN